MAPTFDVVEHVIPGQHIREYPNATKHHQEDVLQLCIKQYIPRNIVHPIPENAVSIIGAHGNGFPKVSLNAPRCSGKRLMYVIGDIRAFLGRSLLIFANSSGAIARYLGSRLFQSGCQWGSE